MPSPLVPSRRHFLRTTTASVAGLAAFWHTPGAFAEALQLTPRQTEGPFYPDRLPLDTDNDLIIVNDNITPAIGEITHLSGKLLDSDGNPIRNATIEIWQVDANGVYLNTRDHRAKRDANFQGFGRFLTASTGDYYFRTVKPVPYPGRTPHIHFKIKQGADSEFNTQCYIKGHPQNERDGVYNEIRDKKARDSVTIDFKPMKDSKTGDLEAHFDIILGVTPSHAS